MLASIPASEAALPVPVELADAPSPLASAVPLPSANEFVENLDGGVRTFISDARYDAVIYSPAIPATLQQAGTVVVDDTPRAGVARPGWFTVMLDGTGPKPIEVRFPVYDSAGHFVSVGQPQDLRDDVAAWFAGQ